MTCPSDERLRTILFNASQETSSTEVLSHLATCPDCKTRIAGWDEQPRLNAFLEAAGNDEVEFLTPPAFEFTRDEPAALTSIYRTPLPRRIGQYEILKSIGRGGGGEVFEARHALLQRRVAIKLMSPQHSGSEVARKRFFREMESIGQLDDPHIVRAYDAGEVDGTLYLAMELIDGENVETMARRIGRLPVSDACEVIRQAALGLQHVHECGLVHRDLKPSNLLISRSGVKIADLGLALLIREGLTDSKLTGHQTVLGTADFMAPEQAEGSHLVDIRADIYSLGCTLFRLLAGHAPFAATENSTPIKKMMAHASKPIPDIRTLRPDIPAGLAELIQNLMSKDRKDRLAEPRHLAEALSPYCRDPDLLQLRLSVAGANDSERSIAVKDVTDPFRTLSKTRQLPETGTSSALRRSAWTRWIAVGGIASVILVLVLWNIPHANPPVVREDPKSNPKTVTLPPDQESIPVPQTLPKTEEKPASPEQEPGKVALIWKNEFGVFPIEEQWPGRKGVAAWALDDQLGKLTIQSDRAIRMIKLGEIGDDDDLTVSVDIESQAYDKACGFYVGFRDNPEAPPMTSIFHVAQVQFRMSIDKTRRVLVQRYHGTLDGRAGTLSSTNNAEHSVQFPGLKNKLNLKVHLNSREISSILVNEIDCDLPNRSRIDPTFVDIPYRGSYGLIVVDGTIWFSNPRLIRR